MNKITNYLQTQHPFIIGSVISIFAIAQNYFDWKLNNTPSMPPINWIDFGLEHLFHLSLIYWCYTLQATQRKAQKKTEERITELETERAYLFQWLDAPDTDELEKQWEHDRSIPIRYKPLLRYVIDYRRTQHHLSTAGTYIRPNQNIWRYIESRLANARPADADPDPIFG